MKLLKLFLLLIFSGSLFAQGKTVKIPFTTGNGGLIYVSATINDVDESFIFDTGASGISISSDIFADLLSNNSISQADILGEVDMSMADGSITRALMVNIKSFKLGDIELNDIEAIVIPQANAPALIGQNMFKKFGTISIDYNKNIISFTKNDITPGDDISLRKIKLILCDKNKSPLIKKAAAILKKSKNISYKNLAYEKNIPPLKAIKRLKGNVTIRIFDNEDYGKAKLIKAELKKYKSFANKKIRIENMLPYFHYKAIPRYIEIWVK